MLRKVGIYAALVNGIRSSKDRERSAEAMRNAARSCSGRSQSRDREMAERTGSEKKVSNAALSQKIDAKDRGLEVLQQALKVPKRFLTARQLEGSMDPYSEWGPVQVGFQTRGQQRKLHKDCIIAGLGFRLPKPTAQFLAKKRNILDEFRPKVQTEKVQRCAACCS